MQDSTPRAVDVRKLVKGLPEDLSLEGKVLSTLSDSGDQLVQSYEAGFRDAIAEGESLYGSMDEMPLFVKASHERRIELLDSLPLGDLSDKVCLDYGVGSWGFACIFPKLQHCAYAIGIDISQAAVQESARLSASGAYPYGKNYLYLTSRGDDIRLQNSSVDVVFAGECIEHIENTPAFLDEIHRILTPGGRLILTTPNADAYFYRIKGDHYAIGPEHVALMSYDELLGYLHGRFEVEVAYGFNGSLSRGWDEAVDDMDVAHAWAALFKDRPDLATGVIVMARRRDDYRPRHYMQRFYHHSAPELQYTGQWTTVPLHREMSGRLGAGSGASLALDFAGDGLILNLWRHAWSGIAQVQVDGESRSVDLYSPAGGFVRLTFEDLPAGPHRLSITGTGRKNALSQGDEVIFYQAVSYTRG